MSEVGRVPPQDELAIWRCTDCIGIDTAARTRICACHYRHEVVIVREEHHSVAATATRYRHAQWTVVVRVVGGELDVPIRADVSVGEWRAVYRYGERQGDRDGHVVIVVADVIGSGKHCRARTGEQ